MRASTGEVDKSVRGAWAERGEGCTQGSRGKSGARRATLGSGRCGRGGEERAAACRGLAFSFGRHITESGTFVSEETKPPYTRRRAARLTHLYEVTRLSFYTHAPQFNRFIQHISQSSNCLPPNTFNSMTCKFCID